MGVTVFFTGLPGSGKSIIARSFARATGFYYIKWGRLVSRRIGTEMDLGVYGEKLAEKERENPLYTVLAVAEEIRRYRGASTVVDGVKTVEQAEGVSGILGTEKIVIYIDMHDRRLRGKLVKIRGDLDDRYSEERDRMLMELGLKVIAEKVPKIYIDAVTLDEAGEGVDVIRKYISDPGAEIAIENRYFNPFMYRDFTVKRFLDTVSKSNPLTLPTVLAEEVLKEIGCVDPEKKLGTAPDSLWSRKVLEYTLTSVEMMDGLLWRRGSVWRKIGVFKTVAYASILAVAARWLSERNWSRTRYMYWLKQTVAEPVKAVEVRDGVWRWVLKVKKSATLHALAADITESDWIKGYITTFRRAVMSTFTKKKSYTILEDVERAVEKMRRTKRVVTPDMIDREIVVAVKKNAEADREALYTAHGTLVL